MNIEFLDAGCGDAIYIRYFGTDQKYHNIFIDGGSEKGGVYKRSIRRKLEDIIVKKENIDIWIISHIDDDHIGGILRLIKDEEIFSQLEISKTTFWYNFSNWDYDAGIRENNLKSVKQAIRLRDYLKNVSSITEQITDASPVIDLWGAKLTVLSPNFEAYNELLKKWENEEIRIRTKESSSLKSSAQNDYKTKINDFNLTNEVVDDSKENASSISFILEYNRKTILFTADCNPNILYSALYKLKNGEKISFDYVQVPHHGSRYNISNKLLELIDCDHYIISGDGFNRSNLPNKLTLVKILAANKNRNIDFYITQANELTRSIFAVDEPHNIKVYFPERNGAGIEIKL